MIDFNCNFRAKKIKNKKKRKKKKKKQQQKTIDKCLKSKGKVKHCIKY